MIHWHSLQNKQNQYTGIYHFHSKLKKLSCKNIQFSAKIYILSPTGSSNIRTRPDQLGKIVNFSGCKHQAFTLHTDAWLKVFTQKSSSLSNPFSKKQTGKQANQCLIKPKRKDPPFKINYKASKFNVHFKKGKSHLAWNGLDISFNISENIPLEAYFPWISHIYIVHFKETSQSIWW